VSLKILESLILNKMIYMQHTEDQFIKYPSTSKAHQIEALVEGVSIDYGYSHPVTGKVHENLVDDNGEVY
jgi:hypothetical protein